MAILTQFIFRLSFGMALAIAITPSRLVTSGFYRVHLYVLMGLNVLASMVAFSDREQFFLWPPLTAAIVSYVGAVIWMYEKPRAGQIALYLVALVTFLGAMLATEIREGTTGTGITLGILDLASSGLLLGVIIAAMFLGHWYLNTPTMELVPLRRLVALMIIAVVIRTVLCAAGLGMNLWTTGPLAGFSLAFISLRWLSGLIGTLVMAWMTWETLKIPNTQSATGILYVGVILAFLGELSSMLLSVETLYPV